MYLKTCWLENTGPITKLDIEMPFYTDGRPKPVVLVGGNGTGKTVVLSYIADALVEIAKKGYQDVVPGQGFISPYLRVLGSVNQKLGTPFSFAMLSFETRLSGNSENIFYREQSGDFDQQEWSRLCQLRFGRNFPWQNGSKVLEGVSEAIAEHAFTTASNCFFPSSRYERPHWHNPAVAQTVNSFDIGINFNKHLGTRPIVITESSSQNHSWLLHVFLDSRADFISNFTLTKQIEFQLLGSAIELFQKQASLVNINVVLGLILCDPNAKLAILPRTEGLSRLCIVKGSEVVIPSLNHLSAGQAILFNTFLTIIRYSDRADASKATSLQEIGGIVLIDEIDAHMHATLQHDILPKLIKIFPKVQFIVTSHAPLFVLGMEQEFGSDGYLLIEMPDGNPISTDRFKEFQHSFDYYRQTKVFEDEQRQRLRTELEKQVKPLVLTEGDTDRDYLRMALTLRGRQDILSKVKIEWIGTTRDGQANSGGDGGLNRALAFLRANTQFTTNQRVMLLYDCDTAKPSVTEGNLWVRTIPRNPVGGASKGIKNLLPTDCFNADNRRFYSRREETGAYGEHKTIESLNKRALCDYICNERREANDFIAFDSVIAIVEDFIANHGDTLTSDTQSEN